MRWSSPWTPQQGGPRPTPGRRWSSGSCTGRSAVQRALRPTTGSRWPPVPATHLLSTRSRDSRQRGDGSAVPSRSSGARSRRFRSPATSPSSATCSRATGRTQEAREQYGLVAAIEKIQAANGSRIDLESALYRTDRGIRLGETLELARLAHVRRPSVAGDDVLAWALARNGRCGEARRWSQRSLRLGTRDASFFFHRGMIERCLGRDADARRWFRLALDTNPHFSLLWSPTARRYAV